MDIRICTNIFATCTAFNIIHSLAYSFTMVPILDGTLLPKDKQVELRLLLSVDSSQYLGDGTLRYVWEQHPNSMWMQ